jgi:hypothetical protein
MFSNFLNRIILDLKFNFFFIRKNPPRLTTLIKILSLKPDPVPISAEKVQADKMYLISMKHDLLVLICSITNADSNAVNTI